MRNREYHWRKCLRLGRRTRRLPKMYNAYDKSKIWAEQLVVIQNDLKRMPSMNYHNVIQIIKRHAATSPWHPYTQGHLYLIYVMGHVLRDEQSIFWGYSLLCNALYKYGPDTKYGTPVFPRWISEHYIPPGLDATLAEHCMRLRWSYVMFGQTFTTPECICTIWDYLLRSRHNTYYMCAALLVHANRCVPRAASSCLLEHWSNIVAIQISSLETAAELIAAAQVLERVHL